MRKKTCHTRRRQEHSDLKLIADIQQIDYLAHYQECRDGMEHSPVGSELLEKVDDNRPDQEITPAEDDGQPHHVRHSPLHEYRDNDKRDNGGCNVEYLS